MNENFFQIYSQNIQKVIAEIKSYENDEDIWIVDDRIPNSAGNLALHLIGNLNHFFGANLGDTGYVRQRDDEFANKNVPREELIEGLKNCEEVLKRVFDNLTDEDLHKKYPEEFGGEVRTVGTIVIYMLTHLTYHLGQINYHRRLLA